jgi:replication factor C large subunit
MGRLLEEWKQREAFTAPWSNRNWKDSPCSGFSGKQRLILFDEIDGLFGNQDRGGNTAVLNVIKQAECPVILTANDIWVQKLSSIKSNTTNIAMKKVHYATIGNYLEKIARQEEKGVSKKAIVEIAKNCSGDVRSALNDLQALTQIDDEDLDVVGERDREQNIFNAVMTILKTKQFDKSRNALKNLAENPDFVMKWIDENIPKEYKDPEELYAAMEKISRADIYLGRVWRRQQYSFWRYASDMMSAGVSLSKKSTYPGFNRYAFPSLIKGLSVSKGKRAVRKEIALKIGKLCHVSSSTAIQDYLPMFEELMGKKEEAVKLTAQFDFDEKELKFFDVSSPKKVIKEAEQIRAKAIIEASRPVDQKGLAQFT